MHSEFVNISTDFNKQELSGLQLLLAQVIYAIAVQKKGGYFVIKFFDTFSCAKTIFHWFRQANFVEISLLNSRAGWVSVTGKKSASAPLKQRDFEQELSAPVFFRR